jgi:hypothetical protein
MGLGLFGGEGIKQRRRRSRIDETWDVNDGTGRTASHVPCRAVKDADVEIGTECGAEADSRFHPCLSLSVPASLPVLYGLAFASLLPYLPFLRSARGTEDVVGVKVR